MSQITYTYRDGHSVTLPIGRNYDVKREQNCEDICLTREVSPHCPLTVVILIRTNGDIALWSTQWSGSGSENANTYWHFLKRPNNEFAETTRRPSEGQLATLGRMWLGLAELPGGLSGALSHPVSAWAFAGQTPDLIAAKHNSPAPKLA